MSSFFFSITLEDLHIETRYISNLMRASQTEDLNKKSLINIPLKHKSDDTDPLSLLGSVYLRNLDIKI